jgi:hypothetical protein
MRRSHTRRSFLGGLGVAGAAAALAPLSTMIRVRQAHGGPRDLATRRVVVVGIGGGLRQREALQMAEGATMPRLFGTVPLVSGGGSGDAGPARIAPEYAARVAPLVLPPLPSAPLHTEGALITNLRYAEGIPGHLQGQACLVSGFYNELENRADARLPVPTIFELYRRHKSAAASDAWYLSVPGGFYRALATSAAPGYGGRYAASYLQPPASVTPIVPIIASGRRSYDFASGDPLPTVASTAAEDAATRSLTAILDGNTPDWVDDPLALRASPADNAAFEDHLAAIYGDRTYQAYFPDSFGIGLSDGAGGLDQTSDALTVFHAEQLLARFKPGLMALTLLDIDTAHGDFNGYLRAQQVADACVEHLWRFIQSTDGLRDETALLVLPEHGRHLFMNGQMPDSLGRSGLDHGLGDDGDRDVFLLALGPDFTPGAVLAPTGVAQEGRDLGRYESIDAAMTAMTLLGLGDVMRGELEEAGARPGLMIQEVMR